MNSTVHSSIVNFIWGIADDCLRDIYVRGKYRDVINIAIASLSGGQGKTTAALMLKLSDLVTQIEGKSLSLID